MAVNDWGALYSLVIPQRRGLLLCLSRVVEYRPFLPPAGFFTGHFGWFPDRRY